MLPFLSFLKNGKEDSAMRLSEVTVKVSAVIEELDDAGLVIGESERTETKATGYLHIYDNGRYLLTYSESGEGGTVTTEIAVMGKRVTVSRKGAIESSMEFEEGLEHRSLYSIPPYRFDALIEAKRVNLELSELKSRIELHYNMKIGGAVRSARKKIWILPNISHA